ncbi:MAG TPA: hypothetical protein VF708_14260 [Pyrinomonadaceae bacterium]|jgi:hypothetical protein
MHVDLRAHFDTQPTARSLTVGFVAVGKRFQDAGQSTREGAQQAIKCDENHNAPVGGAGREGLEK